MKKRSGSSRSDNSETRPANARAARAAAASSPAQPEMADQAQGPDGRASLGPLSSRPGAASSEDASSYEKRWVEMYQRLVEYKKVCRLKCSLVHST